MYDTEYFIDRQSNNSGLPPCVIWHNANSDLFVPHGAKSIVISVWHMTQCKFWPQGQIHYKYPVRSLWLSEGNNDTVGSLSDRVQNQ